MNTLITPVQVLRLAFTGGEAIPPESITEADIAAAEERWIVPVIGRALHAALLEGAHPEFTAQHLAAPTALYTRAAIQSRLDIRTERCGTTAPKSAGGEPAGEDSIRRMRRQLLREARTLLLRASCHLRDHRSDFPQYDPDDDIFRRCRIEGGMILREHGTGTR